MGIQFAKFAGIDLTIATTSMAGGEQELRELGATHVVNRHSKTIVEEVQAITGRLEMVTHIYDCVNFDYGIANRASARG